MSSSVTGPAAGSVSPAYAQPASSKLPSSKSPCSEMPSLLKCPVRSTLQ
jgi:hypothetical protein